MHCQMRVDVLCGVSLSGTMRSVMSVPVRKPAIGDNAGVKHCPLSRTSNGCLNARQECPQVCGIGKSRTLNEPYLELVPQQESKGDRLENTVVETRLRRATLSCSDYKPACKRATARCQIAIKSCAQGSMKAAQLGAVYSCVTSIHSSPLIVRPSSTKCNVGAMSRAPKMAETITPRVKASMKNCQKCVEKKDLALR